MCRVNRGESESFIVDSAVRHGWVISPWLFSSYMNGVMKELETGMGKNGCARLREEEGSEWRSPDPLYAYGLVLWGDSDELKLL